MPETFSLVNKRIDKDAAKLVIKFVQSEKRDCNSIAKAGEYETFLHIQDTYFCNGFFNACCAGYKEIIDLIIMLNKGSWSPRSDDGNSSTRADPKIESDRSYADYWNIGLAGACSGNQKEIAEDMISRGADGWDLGFEHACLNGHKEMMNFMISHGANNWNMGLYGACSGGHLEIAEDMIRRGANDFNLGLYSACHGGHIALMRLMIEISGATQCPGCDNSIESHL